MSRNVTAANHISYSREVKEEQAALEGKLIFTKYKDRDCAMLLKGGRIHAMQALSSENRIGAIYIGKIKNIVNNIDACFVEIADGEICFLPLKDARAPFLCNRTFEGKLREGDELLVQIIREAQKTKQPSVTAHISLATEKAAVSLGSARIGYSAKLSKGTKEQISQWLTESGLQEKGQFKTEMLPPSTGLVIRTAAGKCSKEELLESLFQLTSDFAKLLQSALHRTCYTCVKEAAPAFAAVFDKLVYPYEYSEIVTDNSALYGKLTDYCKTGLLRKKVRFYDDPLISLSRLYSLNSRTEAAFNTRVWLKSGGYLVIEPTEALTVIDVNSGKYESKKDASQGYFLINREAAEEIALQLRLRNLSGIIIVDFINMADKTQQEALLKHLKELVVQDKQKVMVVDMTALGLVELTRKKDNKPLREQFG